MPHPDPHEIEFLRCFVAASDWTVARTMPENPHAYVVRGKTADLAGFDRFVQAIDASGWRGEWGGRTWTYLDVDAHTYWAIGVALNRKPVGDVSATTAGRPTIDQPKRGRYRPDDR
jgi:hypothetical protein